MVTMRSIDFIKRKAKQVEKTQGVTGMDGYGDSIGDCDIGEANLGQPIEGAQRAACLRTLIALQFIDGIGNRRLALLDPSNPLAWLDQSVNRQRFCYRLSDDPKRKLLAFLRAPQASLEWEAANRVLHWLTKHDAGVRLKTDTDFPSRLLEIPDCPAFLYWAGSTSALDKPLLSIVGTRKPTYVSARFASDLATELAALGFTVVSGMASGIDTQAHRGALAAGGQTVAVWATGLDKPYPARNNDLAAEIIKHGCVLTEMPLSTPPLAGYFPRRNRIVSGLSEGVIVVEAGEKSGSMITARLAMEQNREVFAVPGAVNNPQAKGCHQLLREGACLTANIDDVLNNLSGFVSRALIAQQKDSQAEETKQPLPPELADVYALLSEMMEPFELILSRAKISSVELSSALVDLELMGMIAADAGCYAKK